MTAGGQFISWRFIGTMYFKMGLICQLSQNLLISELKGNCQYKKWSCFLQENPGERWKGKWVSKYFLIWQNPISPLTKETRLALRTFLLPSMSEPYLTLKIRLHIHVYTQGHSANVYSEGSFVSGNILKIYCVCSFLWHIVFNKIT